MHYYQFNIGDYIANTARLSDLEDLCYRRLLDLYYLNERPFNECLNSVAREVGMVEQLDTVEFILNQYFQLIDGFWHQNRANREIKAYQNKLKSASKAGKASAKARQLKASEQPLNDSSSSVELNIKHKPLNKNHKPTTNIKDKAVSSKPDPVMQIFSFWCDVMNKQLSTTKLTPKRMQKIKDRLKDYKIQDIKQAITNCSNDPFSMGKNDRQKKFNDIELICRSGEKLESFFDSTKIESESVRRKQIGQNWANEGNDEQVK